MKRLLPGPASVLLGAAIGAGCYFEAAAATPLGGQRSGAWIPVTGTVVALDRAHGVLDLRHAALETAAAGTERCRLAHRDRLKGIHPGQDITALAETDRHPWILDNVRVVRVAH